MEHETGTIRISHKYYEQAEWVLPRLNICDPPPEFVIYVSDLTNRASATIRSPAGRGFSLGEQSDSYIFADVVLLRSHYELH